MDALLSPLARSLSLARSAVSRRPWLVLWILLPGAVLVPARATAQLTSADSAAVILDVAGNLEAAGRAEVARALYELLVERFAATAAGEGAADRLAALGAVGSPGSGRVELQVWSTLYGAFLGVAVPGALGVEGSEPYGLGLLVGGPGGFLFGRSLARGRALTEGQARAITLGGTWGAWQGFGWREVLDLGVDEVCEAYGGERFCYGMEDDSEEAFAAMIVGSLAGVATGAVLSRRSVSPGVATTVNFGALWGSWLGFGVGVLADQDDDALLAFTLLGGDAGLVTTALLAPGWSVSRNRARLVSIAGVIGGLGGAGIDLIAQPDDEKVAIGIPLATSVLGLIVGAASTRAYDERRPGGGSDGGADVLPEGALLQLDGGRWSMRTPLPRPVWAVRDGPRGMERRPALGLTLLHASF